MDNLQPNPNLKELTIVNYPGHICPIWMRGSPHLDLSSLRLHYCHHWETLSFLGQIPHLKELSLVQMYEVKEMDYSCDSTSACAFPFLERLNCQDMPKWESWARPQSCYHFPNLRELIIGACPKLVKLPAIPSSLLKLKVDHVGLDSLPDMYQSSRIIVQVPSGIKSSLTTVEIRLCSKLISLNGFLQQQNLDLQGLEKLSIKNCVNLVQLPTGAFGNFVSLKHFDIYGSPNLVTVDNQSILLPVKLESLKMGNCGELDVSLLESASQLSTLANLYILNSANITCIPSSENTFTSLRFLHINRCNKLVELSSMQQEHTVNPRDNLVSLNISSLHIDNLSLLFIEPLRFLRFVSDLRVGKCSGMDALPEQWMLQNSIALKKLTINDGSLLRSFRDTMVMLTALEELRIYNATLLEEIPKLPSHISNHITREKQTVFTGDDFDCIS